MSTCLTENMRYKSAHVLVVLRLRHLFSVIQGWQVHRLDCASLATPGTAWRLENVSFAVDVGKRLCFNRFLQLALIL